MDEKKPTTSTNSNSPAQKLEFDKLWFTKKLARAKQSQNALARHLGFHPSAMSKLFNGTRQMKLEEAETIARFIKVTTQEVLIHAGVNLGSPVEDFQILTLVDSEGNVRPSPEPIAIPPEMMDRLKANIPMDLRDKYQVALVCSPEGPLWALDDNLLLFEVLGGVNLGQPSSFSILLLRDGDRVMAKVETFRKTGEASIRLPNGEIRDVQLSASSPVLIMFA